MRCPIPVSRCVGELLRVKGLLRSGVVATAVVVAIATASGGGGSPSGRVPLWAHVSRLQLETAKKHHVPVAFENPIGMRFVLIPEGKFEMGSPKTERGRSRDERQHEVTITKPYYMQVTEVTNGEYRRYRRDHDSHSSWGFSLNAGRQPVVWVSWGDCASFARWLSREDGKRVYRLPTEAEWERACRCGTRTRYWWGDGQSGGWRLANGNDIVTQRRFHCGFMGWTKDDGYRVSAPVASYPANSWGLYDLHGNVCEWCRDWYGAYPKKPTSDPRGPAKGQKRVIRGGCWVEEPERLRSAYRWRLSPAHPAPEIGFRLVSPLPYQETAK
jgi:formylglycine-generating enzyme required for sulfatase activity